MRGYAAVGLYRPKDKANLGGVLRAVGCYGAALALIEGDRLGKYATDTLQAWKHIPCMVVDSLLDAVPFGAMPVIIELHDRAKPLPQFVHPERAFYIFGPEDGSVPTSIIDRIPLVVQVPTKYCMNLAATVNVVLYDRLAKRGE